jgi:hypothetical protein
MKQLKLMLPINNVATHSNNLPIRIGGFLPAVYDDELTSLGQVTTLAGGDVFQSLSAQGTTNATTSIMSYGVNVFTTSTQTDFCTKLPQPTTGKRSTIVNMSTQTISVHPSNIGGKINNLPVDTPLAIPNDGKAYEFICTENPLPGGWNVVSPPATTQHTLSEISVAHTNGTHTYAYGYGGAQLLSSTSEWQASVTASEDLPTQSINLFPSAGHWLNIPGQALITKVKLYSNFVAADGTNAPSFGRFVVWKPAANSFAVYTAVGSGVSLQGASIATGSTLSVPPEVGDSGTYYSEAATLQHPDMDAMGSGTFSNHYQMIQLYIPANAATKTYKFQIFLEYV